MRKVLLTLLNVDCEHADILIEKVTSRYHKLATGRLSSRFYGPVWLKVLYCDQNIHTKLVYSK